MHPPPRALREWGVHLPCSKTLSCAAQRTSLHMITEKGDWEMAALTMVIDPASTVMEAKSPWNQRPIRDWLPKGDLAICPLPCPHPPLTPSHQSPQRLPKCRLLNFLNQIQRRVVDTAVGRAWFQAAASSLDTFRLFFLLLAKKILEGFKFRFLLS